MRHLPFFLNFLTSYTNVQMSHCYLHQHEQKPAQRKNTYPLHYAINIQILRKLYLRRKIQCSTPFVACSYTKVCIIASQEFMSLRLFSMTPANYHISTTPSCFAFGRLPHLVWFVHVKFRNRLDKTYPTFKSCFATEN